MAVGGLSATVFATAVFAPAIAAAAPARQATASEISTEKDAKLGTILVAGNTVYTLKASKTACTAACLKAWPPVLLADGVTTPTAGTGVDAAKLGTKPTAGGALQVTYGGKQLYFSVKDTAPGDVHGNVTNKWGKWSVIVTKSSTGSGGTSTTNAGTGGAAF
jgi:predicted lipoprotein with Yx(FWY)xxD motif